jgi:FkbM family methyltransferase
MDLELKLLRGLTTRLPGVPGAGFLANSLSEFYNRRPRSVVDCESYGWKLRLDPREAVERGMLFFPQLYERRERRFLEQHLRSGNVFLDVGANVGFYSLLASRLVGPTGRVLAFEADPDTHKCLAHHVAQNGAGNVTCINAGVSDRNETLHLVRNRGGNRGGNSFVTSGSDAVPVACAPIIDFLERHAVAHVDAMKIDIEGMESRVLGHFFAHAPKALWPNFMVLEDNPAFRTAGAPHIDAGLTEKGYRIVARVDLNILLARTDRPGSGE